VGELVTTHGLSGGKLHPYNLQTTVSLPFGRFICKKKHFFKVLVEATKPSKELLAQDCRNGHH
jgi:hypothetical protein